MLLGGLALLSGSLRAEGTLSVQRLSEPASYRVLELEFTVPEASGAVPSGFARIAPNKRYFETDHGEPLPLIGHCVCWHHRRGTADYVDWFDGMAAAGENYSRLWMWPHSFGLEAAPDSGLNYRLDRAWQLDRVFELAGVRAIWLMLCFDYHGMFEIEPDFWGGNDNWKLNPYNAVNGGPCADQKEFFSLPAAKAMYRKRLRYLIDRYDKPMMVGEYGTDWRGWKREQDPHLRGWRQGIWAAALSGAVGNSMSWWWESIHAGNLYATFGALRRFLDQTGFTSGAWTPIRFPAATPAPSEVGRLLPGGEPFDVMLNLDAGWGAAVSGRLAVANPTSASEAPAHLNAFVHGTSHADLRRPFQLSALLDDAARLVLHLNSVSEGAILSVLVDGQETLRRELPNRDGQYEVNGEYDEDIALALPAGKHLIEVRNAGADWFNLDWARTSTVEHRVEDSPVSGVMTADQRFYQARREN